MTLDEMIKCIEERMNYTINPRDTATVGEAIIAALRAAEEMRNALPKLLDVVEAAKDIAPFLEEDHVLVDALAALNK